MDNDNIRNDNGSIAFYTYDNRWLYTWGLYQDFLFKIDEHVYLRFGHSLGGFPIGRRDLRDHRGGGGWYWFLGLNVHRITGLFTLGMTENTHGSISLTYTF